MVRPAPSECSISRLACFEYAFCRFLPMVVKSTSVVVSRRAGRMLGNVGAPACVGMMPDTLGCCSLSRSVLFRADGMVLATARSGTRSKYRPALPRITRSWEADGDHTKPMRGDTLLVS